MSETRTMRLNKVLRELNISLDRAVEYLAKNNYQIEARPTTKISNEIYEVLKDGFETDANKKAASKEVSEEKRKEKEAIRLELEAKIEKRRIEEEEKEEVLKAKAEKLAIKKVGKIDIATQKPFVDEEPEIIAEEKLNEEASEKEVQEISEVSNLQDESIQKKETESKSSDESEKIKTKYQRLDGPKLTGKKIDLKQFEKVNKSPDNKSNESTDKNDASKRKRKRINKSVIPNQDYNKSKNNKSGNSRGAQRKRPVIQKQELTEAEIQKQVRETLEKLQGKSSKGKGAKYRRNKRDAHRELSDAESEALALESKISKVTEFVTVSEVATMMDVAVTEIISACMMLGMMVTMNQRLDAETLKIVAEEFGFMVEFVGAEVEESIEEFVDRPQDLVNRAPIITVMGHVDHGKTSLLDYIRKANVTDEESGGITQHIGAYSVNVGDQKIAFLDTPGHEAFTAMRARGAQVTDLVIIVAAADDDVMPQTKEAISHAQAAGVPIIFAINKIDKPNANPDNVKTQLSSMNLLVEEWGGNIQSQDISAKTGEGIPELLEKVLLEAEILELKANPNKNAVGAVVEAQLDKGRGYVTTILVQAGTLKIGDYILAGKNSGKVKAMFDDKGNNLTYVGRIVNIESELGEPNEAPKIMIDVDTRNFELYKNKRLPSLLVQLFFLIFHQV